MSAQSQGRRAAAGRDAVQEGRGSQGRGPRELTAGRFVHPSVTASVRWPSVRPEPVRPELCAARGGAEAWRGGPEPAPGPFPCLRLRGGILAGKG